MSTIVYPVIKFNNVDLLLDVAQVELSADALAGASTFTVFSITGVGVGDYLMVGEFGQETSEIVRVSTGVAPSGTTITLNAVSVYAHPRGTMVYRIDRDKVEFSRATTLTGSKSVLATNAIQTDQLFTVYEDTTNTTGFGFTRANNSADSTFSNYSESYPYAGYSEQTVKKIFDSALSQLGLVDDQGQPQFPGSISREVGIQAINDCQQELKEMKHRWSYLTSFNYSVGELATGQDVYTLPTDIAEKNGQLSILAARIGTQIDLKFIDKMKLNDYRTNMVKDSLGAAITSIGNTTVTLTDSSDFDTTGSIFVVDDDNAGYDTIAYTGNNKATNVLSGVTLIAETHVSGSIVWQGNSFAKPVRYTVFEGTITLDPPPSVTWDDTNLYIDAYVEPVVVNDLADEADFPSSVIKPYVAMRFAMILDGGPSARSAGFKQDYLIEQNKIIKKEDTGHAPRLRPNRLPDVTSNFALRRRSEDSNN